MMLDIDAAVDLHVRFSVRVASYVKVVLVYKQWVTRG